MRSDTNAIEIPLVPKGLRSFDAEDAEFFLRLLPGPRDSAGLPQSIRCWKSRIEESDSTNTFRAGLIYGQSGCGKSSLVKAGLLPHLAGHVKPIFVEASADHTEAKLLRQLQLALPQTKSASNLNETLDLLLRDDKILHPQRKVILVLDQFEQWIQAHPDPTGQDLLQAVARCDGEKLQCLILVRDDFYVGVSRFFAALDIDLSSTRNQALVDRFDLKHAREVLTAFGRAYGRLPKAPIG